MNCQRGDLAILIEDLWLEGPLTGERIAFCKAGAFVRCVELEPDNCWRIEEPRAFSLSFPGTITIHVVGVLTAIRDDVLRPIRAPRADAVDEMVRLVGPAPITLTEIREWSEAA